MARTINGVMYPLFAGESYNSGLDWWATRVNVSNQNLPKLHMEIPINKKRFEVPTFAWDAFMKVIKRRLFDYDSIVVPLTSYDRIPRYKTMDRYMRDIILCDYSNNKLVKLDIKRFDKEIRPYFGCHGAIFAEDLYPLMICSWEIKRGIGENGLPSFTFVKPILRVSPECFLCQDDAMKRWIVKKAMTACLEEAISTPFIRREEAPLFHNTIDNVGERVHPSLVIEEFPFHFKQTDTPSISTTNGGLIKIALDHLDEVVV